MRVRRHQLFALCCRLERSRNDVVGRQAVLQHVAGDGDAGVPLPVMSIGFMGAEHADIPIGGTVAGFAQGPVGL